MRDRVLVITGGAGGVGRTVTLRWLREGASVLVVDRAQAALDEVREAWEATGEGEDTAAAGGADPGRLAIWEGDVTTGEGAAEMFAQAGRTFGRPADTLLHLVGGFGMGPLDAPDAPAVWDRMMALNLTSSFHCYRAALPALRARGGGWIVGLASRAALTPGPKLAAYAASKAGLIALTQSLSAEVRGENIHVNAILASTIDTPANRAAMGERNAADWVTPDDIADATLFLCSDRARAVHGATLEVYARA
jgi:NAD(P)-dependent dehydrogenase (short-subunit alcohol dehydrogenase family)